MDTLPQDQMLRFQAFNSKALEEVQKGNPGAALAHLEEALGILEDAKVLGNYGDALARCGRVDEARRAFERAIEIDPGYDQAHYNLGVVLYDLGDLEASTAAYLRSIECRVTAPALNNVARNETYLLRLAAAEEHYRRAIKHGYPDARWNLSITLAMRGKWKEAWDLYENRPQMRDYASHPLLWRGEALEGRTLVVVTEQGLGDSIFALRYLPMLREEGARLIIACEAPLKRLIEVMVGGADPKLPPVLVVDRANPGNQPYDYVTLAMSIPGYRSPEGTGPARPYLKAERVRLGHGFHVGLCWNGSTVVGPPKERNIPLKLLAPLAAIPHVKLVSLQKGEAAAEMADCGFEIRDAMATARDVYDTACVVNSLDLVISIDTMIPHLAGALGRPVWLMNRWMSCWQWGTNEYQPNLYSTVAHFRQLTPGDWDPVVQMITHSLRHTVNAFPELAEEQPA